MSARRVPERIRYAAVRTPGGFIYRSKLGHFEALEKALAAEPELNNEEDLNNSIEDGFITSHGRFVDREEAFAIAALAKQLDDVELQKMTSRGYDPQNFQARGGEDWSLSSEDIAIESCLPSASALSLLS